MIRGTTEVAKSAHGGRGISGTGGHDWRPLIRSVSVFLHVLRQVGFLCVRFTTIRTNVRFQVFRLLVLWDMFQQGGLVMETLVAGVTFVWFICLVTSGV